jgi:hypothetical protein
MLRRTSGRRSIRVFPQDDELPLIPKVKLCLSANLQDNHGYSISSAITWFVFGFLL